MKMKVKSRYALCRQYITLKNNELIIDSGLVECKFKNDYLLISVDTTYSMNPEKVSKKKLKYFIENKQTLYDRNVLLAKRVFSRSRSAKRLLC